MSGNSSLPACGAPEFRWAGYQLFVLVLCVYAIAALALHAILPANGPGRDFLDTVDYVVCGIFFIDFLVSLATSPNRTRYFVTWGWLDLLSSVPALPVARLGRVARLLRIFRLIRGIRATKIFVSLLMARRAENAFLAASLVALLMLVCCGSAILHFEAGHPGANICTAEDALWWGVTTLTTVGYGDRFPVTTEGRIVAAVLMIAGLGLFGTLSGFVAAWFLGSPSQDTAIADDWRSEIANLRQLIEDRLPPSQNR
jgi:voltage-gated potassium channel